MDSVTSRRSSAPSLAVARWAGWIVESLKRDYLFQYCAVLVDDPSSGALRLVAQRWGAGEDVGLVPIADTFVPIEGSICGRVFRTGAPALLQDVRDDLSYRSFPGASMRSEVAVPILGADRVVGVINVESPRIAAFDIADLNKVIGRAAEAAAVAPPEVLCVS